MNVQCDILFKYMKTKTLKEAIGDAVSFFLNRDDTFSIYDVTELIRRHVNDEDYKIDDPDHDLSEDMPYPILQNIPHDVVREEFLNMFENSELSIEIEHRGRYVTYKQLVTAELETKIRDYISNKGEATIKQIQSRLKRDEITCSQIYDIVKNGFTLIGDGGPVSKIICQNC